MDEIPLPDVLDGDRLLIQDRDDMTVDHEARAKLLDKALHQSCDYAEALWRQLDSVRHYLIDSAPENPRVTDAPVRRSARPTGPDDDAGWESWSKIFMSVTSALTGPSGDSGYGEREASREARDRRLDPGVATDESP